ncbi:hypothetical protein B0T24DRAFT_633598 [Lasiosphaeria ovina]|uniref:NACHT-NTPase and P-loop NTPases N-terminal domain-containing protein n=1 Tax=Lasiosphaeria ovina TaxID=92902 RepID=A0AAE0N0X2_9PEZI|nr:hypothetical protein B0T24DRAFT_633598 [Lasiosphaeria ovina]
MSFGWSAGDVVAALGVLNKVRNALKESSGASSDYQGEVQCLRTLSLTIQNIDKLPLDSLNPELSRNVQEYCKQLKDPLFSFIDRIQKCYETTIGPASTTPRLLSAPKKIHWALSTAKKVRELRDKVAGPLSASCQLSCSPRLELGS